MLHGTGKACYSPAASFGIIFGALAVNYTVQHVAKLPVTNVKLPSKKGDRKCQKFGHEAAICDNIALFLCKLQTFEHAATCTR